uniref:RING-type domain-containing protein n=1 Tax=Ditylenchus dipsaci TaxID=166011 RepID=A0A915EC32_9BILA
MTVIINQYSSGMHQHTDWESQSSLNSKVESMLPSNSKPLTTSTLKLQQISLLTSLTGQCPYCKRIFLNPVALPCGHSLCSECSKDLLYLQLQQSQQAIQTIPSHRQPQRNRICMGISSLSRLDSSNLQVDHVKKGLLLREVMSTPRPSTSSMVHQSNRTTSSLTNRQSKARRLLKGIFSANESIDKLEEDGQMNSARPKSTLISTRHLYQSPKCPVCGVGPRLNAPIRNLALEQLVQLLLQQNQSLNPLDHHKQCSTIHKENSSASSSTSSIRSRSSSSGFDEISSAADSIEPATQFPTKTGSLADLNQPLTLLIPSKSAINERKSVDQLTPLDFVDEDSDEDISLLQTCKIAIFGAPKVGKSQLASTQSLNSLFFGKIKEKCTEKEVNSAGSLRAKYRLCILDNNNQQEDLHEADGIIMAYSTSDRKSFEVLKCSLFQEIRLRRADDPPIILVATKSDLKHGVQSKRNRNNSGSANMVPACEGQALARSFNCPFLEVSSKANDKVNEIFLQLIHLIDSRKSSSPS